MAGLLPDPVWTERFDRERARIAAAPGDPIGVYHVGSTAIPDLAGYPELDVIAVYPDVPTMNEAAAALTAESEDWQRTDADDAVVVYRRPENPSAHTEAIHLKLHLPGDQGVYNQLVFRDYLRDHASARRRYERVKREAAAEHPKNEHFQAYQTAKADVVASILEDARAAGYDDRLPADI